MANATVAQRKAAADKVAETSARKAGEELGANVNEFFSDCGNNIADVASSAWDGLTGFASGLWNGKK